MFTAYAARFRRVRVFSPENALTALVTTCSRSSTRSKLNRTVLVGHSFGGTGIEFGRKQALGPSCGPGLPRCRLFLRLRQTARSEHKGNAGAPRTSTSAPRGAEFDQLSVRCRNINERVNGIPIPRSGAPPAAGIASRGGVGKTTRLPGNGMLMDDGEMGSKKYTIFRTALVIFANPHSLGTWVDANTRFSVRTVPRPIPQRWQLLQRGKRRQLKMVCHGACDHTAACQSLRLSYQTR